MSNRFSVDSILSKVDKRQKEKSSSEPSEVIRSEAVDASNTKTPSASPSSTPSKGPIDTPMRSDKDPLTEEALKQWQMWLIANNSANKRNKFQPEW